jgi:hypothetical protein
MSYQNSFKTQYCIAPDLSSLTLPLNPPRSDGSRHKIYGKSIHGWEGQADITFVSDDVYWFHPRGYTPRSAQNPENDRTAWEEVHVHSSEHMTTKFWKGDKFVTYGTLLKQTQGAGHKHAPRRISLRKAEK